MTVSSRNLQDGDFIESYKGQGAVVLSCDRNGYALQVGRDVELFSHWGIRWEISRGDPNYVLDLVEIVCST